MIVLLAGLGIFGSMLAEAAISRRHERALRARGAVEPARDVYAAMQMAYPSAFVVMLAEGAARHVIVDAFVAAGAVIFVAAKALKYWAMLSLGARWTFRVLVPPHSERTRRGPYRWLSHPNYVGVAGELAGCALAMHAIVCGPLAVTGFGALLLRRIRIEEAALAE